MVAIASGARATVSRSRQRTSMGRESGNTIGGGLPNVPKPPIKPAVPPTAQKADRRPPKSMTDIARESGDGSAIGIMSPINRLRADFAGKIDEKYTSELESLTGRYGGNADLARRVADSRRARLFAASDPDLNAELVMLQQQIDEMSRMNGTAASTLGGGTGGL